MYSGQFQSGNVDSETDPRLCCNMCIVTLCKYLTGSILTVTVLKKTAGIGYVPTQLALMRLVQIFLQQTSRCRDGEHPIQFISSSYLRPSLLLRPKYRGRKLDSGSPHDVTRRIAFKCASSRPPPSTHWLNNVVCRGWDTLVALY
ncbi:unnamed protein product [Timema podura]|uniref:Uncharacterized protein n=1 Tax=Timema podura TaxID=61482 RepID=A0ABN7PI49_TIMPD|nr:unnamed protein product [Timema podura]